MQVLEKTLNRLNLLMEISDYQAAAALIGLPTELTSDKFLYFNAAGAIAFCETDRNSARLSEELARQMERIHDRMDALERKADDIRMMALS